MKNNLKILLFDINNKMKIVTENFAEDQLPNNNIYSFKSVIKNIIDRYIQNISAFYNIDIDELNELWLNNFNKKKICKTCKIEKNIENFHREDKMKDGYRLVCKECRLYNTQNKENTLDRLFYQLLNSSESSSKTRNKKGRIKTGIYNITFSDLKGLWVKQNGKCYYSNIQMNYNKRDWKISLERLNSDKGYIKDNIVLCCQEFNGCSQWSKEKIKEILKILHKDIKDNYVSFELEKKDRKKRQKISKIIIKNIEYYKCTYCKEVKQKYVY